MADSDDELSIASYDSSAAAEQGSEEELAVAADDSSDSEGLLCAWGLLR